MKNKKRNKFNNGLPFNRIREGKSIVIENPPDLSFTAHDDATSHGCTMCGNEWKSLNRDGYCSSCWTIWNS